jgi:hypothetical protein
MPLALTTSMFVGMPGLPDHGPHLAGNIGTREWPIPRSHFRSLFPFSSQLVSQGAKRRAEVASPNSRSRVLALLQIWQRKQINSYIRR